MLSFDDGDFPGDFLFDPVGDFFHDHFGEDFSFLTEPAPVEPALGDLTVSVIIVSFFVLPPGDTVIDTVAIMLFGKVVAVGGIETGSDSPRAALISLLINSVYFTPPNFCHEF